MNADGQRFHLLLGRSDWARGKLADARKLVDVWHPAAPLPAAPAPGWDERRNELTLAPRPELLPPTLGDITLSPDIRRAAASDAFGNVYWIGDDATQLFVHSRGDGSNARFWPDTRAQRPVKTTFAACLPEPGPQPVYRAIAATGDGWLVAATATGIDSFDLIAGGPPLHYDWPKGTAPTVTDLEARGDCGLWLLDGPAKMLFAIDRTLTLTARGTPMADLFQPVSGAARMTAPTVAPTGFDLSALAPAINPIAIAALPDGAVAVLSRSPDLLCVWLPDGAMPPAAIALDFVPHDMVAANVALRGGEAALRVLVSGGTGNQVAAFKVEGTGAGLFLDATAEAFPLRRYGGRALVSILGNAAYDSGPEPRWTRIVEKPRQRFNTDASFHPPVFDSGLPGAIWDRLRLDGCIPPGSKVTVDARASDDPVQTGAWIAQPSPILSRSGSELVAHAAAAIVATDTVAQHGTFELLFQRAEGQYLELRVSLASDGDTSPRLRALRASWPRVSWAQKYLPAFWREEPESADFLERFLANMQGTTSAIESRIVVAQAMFDTRTVSAEALPWLAEWFDVALDPSWDEPRRRAFVAHAVKFFGWRGTMKGLESALALAFGEPLDATLFGDSDCTCPGAIRIVETYRTRVLGRIGAGDSSSVDDAVVHDAGIAERDRWRAFLVARGRTGAATASLPRLSVPPSRATDWTAFLALASHDRRLWQRFLEGRYRRTRALNTAHGSNWNSFGEVALCDTAPATAIARTDWASYVDRLLPIDRTAHRFSVLIPVKPGEPTDAATLAAKESLAKRIVALEKPAHTVFDIRFFFAANRIGEARLAYDTAIGAGSRAPELLPSAILGRAYIGESFVGPNSSDMGGALSLDRRRLAC